MKKFFVENFLSSKKLGKIFFTKKGNLQVAGNIKATEGKAVISAELDEFVEKVRERSDIVSVVSRYVQLNLKGGKYWACCPFHNEKTASFSVTPDKGLFYCFGCHEGGNVFNFIAKIENLSYFDAVKLQAERVGVPLPSRKKTPRELEQENEEKILRKVTEQAKNFYQNCLINTAEGETGRKYLNSRGITTDVIEKFQLGYAPNSWDSLSKNFLQRGFTEKQLVSAGLVSERKSGGVYDRMRGRVIIPIADIFGHIVGFGGRILNSEDEKNSPKYLNSPETILFNKRNLLFGLDKAHDSISKKNCAIVVEGYMDAISLVSAGVENVVATLGTSFTVEHAKLILRYARKIIFCYDSDDAGQNATVRALPIVREAGAEVFVITVPDGKDPDDFIRKHGKQDFDKLIKNASPLVEYRINFVLRTTEHSTLGGKIDALRKILPVVVNVKSSTRRSEYRKKISNMLVLDESVVMQEWQKVSSQPADEVSKVPQKKIQAKRSAKNKFDSAESAASEVVLRMAWYECDLLEYVLTLVPKEIFSQVHREIIDYLEKCFAEDRRPNDVTAAAELSKTANTELSRIILSGSDSPRDNELPAFEDAVKTLRLAYMKEVHARKLKEVESYIDSGNPEYAKLFRESLKLKNEMDELQFAI